MTYREKTRDGVTRLTGAMPEVNDDPNPSANFTFPTPSTVWLLPHNLGQYVVTIITYDNNGDEMLGDPIFIDLNNAKVEFYHPAAGTCRVQS